MTSQSSGRTAAIFVSAVFLASLAAAMVASPAAAAKPKCFGKTATIIGTAKGEVITGTKRADVIVARGGHDRIYGKGGNDIICGNKGNDRIYLGAGSDLALGGTGHDRLFGNAGPDRLLGGPGNDSFNGGIGVDLCAQGSGSGPRVNCERPPVLPPPPSGPTLIPLTGILAVAYSDIDGLDGYSTGDVMIAKLVDASGNGEPSAGDIVEMGRYPKDLDATAFGEWGVKSHDVTGAFYNASEVNVTSSAGSHRWQNSPPYQNYVETSPNSAIQDGLSGSALDTVVLNPSSPSQPADTIPVTGDSRPGDDPIVDVELNY